MKCIKIIIWTFTTLSFVGCFQEPIDLDLNQGDNEKLVVEAWISNLDEQQKVTLSLTADYLDSLEVNYVNDAEVFLTYNQETLTLSPQGQGEYTLPMDWVAETDIDYTLEVVYQDESYVASSFMKEMPELEEIRAEFFERRDSIDYYDVFFGFQETEGEGDGYYGIDYLKGTMVGDTLTNGGFTSDEFSDGIYFSDVTLTNDGYEIGDTVILEAYSIGKEASDFLLDIISEVFREGLFDAPPVNVRSNFTNGALGYFIASGGRQYEIVIE